MAERVKKNGRIIPLVLVFSVLAIVILCVFVFASGSGYIAKTNGDNPPEYGTWDDDDELDLEKLPDDAELARQVEELFSVKSIPVVNLSTEVEIIEDDNVYKKLSMSITDGAVEENNYKNLTGGIRPRGNSTYRIGREYGAMPYKIKLDERVDLLGMGESKKWCLIANFIDRSYVKQFVMYQTAQLMMGEEYFQPKAKYVEVYMNGEYKGLYLLTESIEEDEGRVGLEVNLADYEENMPFLLEMEEMGYICEDEYKSQIEQDFLSMRFFADSRATMPTWLLDDDMSNDECSYTPYSLQYPKSFDDMSEYQEENLRRSMYDLFESAELGVSIGQLGLDMNSFVNYYLFMDVFSSTTFVGPSVFMYREPGLDIIKMGPLWDFDTAMLGGTDGSVELKRNTLYKHLYRYKTFRGALANKYEEFEEKLFPLMREAVSALGENKILKSAVLKSEAKHNTWGRSLNRHNGALGSTQDIPDPTILSLKSFEAHVKHINDWLFDGFNDVRGYSVEGRTVWLSENIDRWQQ